MADRSWINEDDPWLVKAMEVNLALHRDEQKLIKAVAKAMDEFLSRARTDITADNIVAAQLPDIFNMWPPDQFWVDLVQLHILPVVRGIFDRAFKAAIEGVSAAVDIWRAAYMAEVEDRLAPGKWPRDAFEKVRGIIQTGIEAGQSVQALTKILKDVLSIGGTVDGSPVWEFDARRIARTETMGAYNMGTYNGTVAWEEATGETRFKRWLSTSDSRTRETHVIANGQIQPLREHFHVGAARLQAPGDPRGPANEVIQCRCTFLVLSQAEAENAIIAAQSKGTLMPNSPDEAVTEPVEQETAAEETTEADDTITAAGPVPAMAPKEWFEKPDLDRPTPITVSSPNEHGFRRVFGHVAARDVCHTGIAASKGTCVTFPSSPSNYAMFNRIPYETDQGMVSVGRITSAHGALTAACECCPGSDDHACLRYNHNQTLAHHDRMDALSYVAVGEDEHGIWAAGVAASDLNADDLAVLARQKVSGDWRGGELLEVLALSSQEPGFPIPREHVDAGTQVALFAAGTVCPDVHEPVQPDMDALVAGLVDAQLGRRDRAEKMDREARELRLQALDMQAEEMS